MSSFNSSADEFFRKVDELLTPSMLRLGYQRIGGKVNDQPSSRAILLKSEPRQSHAESKFLAYDFGFEAISIRVRQLVYPDDPKSADELWLSYSPSGRELDMRDWAGIATGRVDWDCWSDTGPCTDQEVERRLAAMGRAVVDFGRAAEESPPAS